MVGTHGGWIKAAAVVGHLDRDDVAGRGDADRGAGCPGVFDHVGQGFLADAVQLLFDLGSDREALSGPSTSIASPSRVLSADACLASAATSPSSASAPGWSSKMSVRISASAPRVNRRSRRAPPDRSGGIELLELQRVLRGSDVDSRGEQRLGDRVVQVAGDALSFQGGAFTLAALRLGQLQRRMAAFADDRRQTAGRQRCEG